MSLLGTEVVSVSFLIATGDAITISVKVTTTGPIQGYWVGLDHSKTSELEIT